MISSISGFLNLNNLDMTSDANDVIVVRHPDGRLYSTPFNVRFGKVKVLRPSDKVVRVEVNGVMTSAVMKMGPDGEAFWLKPTRFSKGESGRPESPIIAAAAATSNANSSPELGPPSEVLQHPTHAATVPSAAAETAADAREGKVAPQPLIEEDYDGHLKVNAEARQSVTDMTEVQLAEKTVVAAERAMRRIAQLHIEDDEYLRNVAKTEGVLSPKLAADEGTTGSFSMAHGNEGFTAAPLLSSAADGGETPPLFAPTAVQFLGADTVDTAQAVASVEDPLPEGQLIMSTSGIMSASDDGFDALDDDYLLEESVRGEAEGFCDWESSEPKTGDDVAAATAGAGASFSLGGGAPHLARQEGAPACIRGTCNTTRSRRCCSSSITVGSAAAAAAAEDDDDDDDADSNTVYFARTLIPTEADLQKLNLVEEHNRVRYITQSSLRGEVAVEANVYLWDSTDRLVVSDVDGTVTKSDVWGHLMPLIGCDWTHPGICALYTKISQNGYKLVYLTARSVSQVSMTRNFLWKIEQDGYRLPKGPVLTAPQRFFTALTLEVSKKSHIFKIACLKSVLDTFPPHSKPFYAGFGNRFNDVLSYTATNIPQHKIFVIDSNSVLHVYKVKQTYKNLAHLVDVTFPHVVKRRHHQHHHSTRDGWKKNGVTEAEFANTDAGVMGGASPCGSISLEGSDSQSSHGVGDDERRCVSSSAAAAASAGGGGGGSDARCVCCADSGGCEGDAAGSRLSHEGVDVAIDQEFHSFLYWRVPPADLVEERNAEGGGGGTTSQKKHQHPEGSKRTSWLNFGSISTVIHNNSSKNNSTNRKELSESDDRGMVKRGDGPAAALRQEEPNAAADIVLPGNSCVVGFGVSTHWSDVNQPGEETWVKIDSHADDTGRSGAVAFFRTGQTTDHVVTPEVTVPVVISPSPSDAHPAAAAAAPSGKEGSSRSWLFWKSTETSVTNTSMDSVAAAGEKRGAGEEQEEEEGAALLSHAPRDTPGEGATKHKQIQKAKGGGGGIDGSLSMEFDEDILPLMQKMNVALDRMQTELLPLFSTLNEDVLVTDYSVDEQARISLATAFALVLLMYAHDRLQRKTRTSAANQQVQLKMERVAEYIKKLRQIADLDNQQQPKREVVPRTGGKGGRKREREEACDSKREERSGKDALHAEAAAAASNLPSNAVDTSVDPYGDSILFKEVERTAGRTALLVQNLLLHVTNAKDGGDSS